MRKKRRINTPTAAATPTIDLTLSPTSNAPTSISKPDIINRTTIINAPAVNPTLPNAPTPINMPSAWTVQNETNIDRKWCGHEVRKDSDWTVNVMPVCEIIFQIQPIVKTSYDNLPYLFPDYCNKFSTERALKIDFIKKLIEDDKMKENEVQMINDEFVKTFYSC